MNSEVKSCGTRANYIEYEDKCVLPRKIAYVLKLECSGWVPHDKSQLCMSHTDCISNYIVDIDTIFDCSEYGVRKAQIRPLGNIRMLKAT